MKSNYIPSDIKCFWCNGHMQEHGATAMGAGMNYITYFCNDCGGIAHFAVDTERDTRIESFEIKYNRSKIDATNRC